MKENFKSEQKSNKKLKTLLNENGKMKIKDLGFTTLLTKDIQNKIFEKVMREGDIDREIIEALIESPFEHFYSSSFLIDIEGLEFLNLLPIADEEHASITLKQVLKTCKDKYTNRKVKLALAIAFMGREVYGYELILNLGESFTNALDVKSVIWGCLLLNNKGLKKGISKSLLEEDEDCKRCQLIESKLTKDKYCMFANQRDEFMIFNFFNTGVTPMSLVDVRSLGIRDIKSSLNPYLRNIIVLDLGKNGMFYGVPWADVYKIYGVELNFVNWKVRKGKVESIDALFNKNVIRTGAARLYNEFSNWLKTYCNMVEYSDTWPLNDRDLEVWDVEVLIKNLALNSEELDRWSSFTPADDKSKVTNFNIYEYQRKKDQDYFSYITKAEVDNIDKVTIKRSYRGSNTVYSLVEGELNIILKFTTYDEEIETLGEVIKIKDSLRSRDQMIRTIEGYKHAKRERIGALGDLDLFQVFKAQDDIYFELFVLGSYFCPYSSGGHYVARKDKEIGGTEFFLMETSL